MISDSKSRDRRASHHLKNQPKPWIPAGISPKLDKSRGPFLSSNPDFPNRNPKSSVSHHPLRPNKSISHQSNTPHQASDYPIDPIRTTRSVELLFDERRRNRHRYDVGREYELDRLRAKLEYEQSKLYTLQRARSQTWNVGYQYFSPRSSRQSQYGFDYPINRRYNPQSTNFPFLFKDVPLEQRFLANHSLEQHICQDCGRKCRREDNIRSPKLESNGRSQEQEEDVYEPNPLEDAQLPAFMSPSDDEKQQTTHIASSKMTDSQKHRFIHLIPEKSPKEKQKHDVDATQNDSQTLEGDFREQSSFTILAPNADPTPSISMYHPSSVHVHSVQLQEFHHYQTQPADDYQNSRTTDRESGHSSSESHHSSFSFH